MLAVRCSNAVNTGQNALRAMLGTATGIIVGGLLITVIGDHTTAWWILLPLVVAFTGVATAALSFAAGQAGFTLFLILLFDLIAPTGWSIGVVRIEDVVLGCGVSVVVGLLLWPRGAGSALRQEPARTRAEGNFARLRARVLRPGAGNSAAGVGFTLGAPGRWRCVPGVVCAPAVGSAGEAGVVALGRPVGRR
jgi:uncharacterized membrane protein YgaE (UPF0421/DUF939 family)